MVPVPASGIGQLTAPASPQVQFSTAQPLAGN
jgi:hypothetical protein